MNGNKWEAMRLETQNGWGHAAPLKLQNELRVFFLKL